MTREGETPARLGDLSDVMIDVIMGYECNVRCDYCSIHDAQRPENMTTARILAELRRGWEDGIRSAAFGGGEPTMRKDLLPLVRWCRDRAFHTIKVSSNGLLYSYPQVVADAIEAGVTRFNVSLMGHTPGLYESIMRRPGTFDLAVRGVDNLVAAGQAPVADLIVKSDTWAHLPQMVDFWAARGVRSFALWLVSLTDRNAAFPASLPRVSEMRPGIVGAMERGRSLGVEVVSRHIPRCMLRGYEDHVHDLREDRVLVVTPGSRFALWESVISPSTYTPRCDGCAFRGGACLGARRDYLERWGDGELEPVPAISGDGGPRLDGASGI